MAEPEPTAGCAHEDFAAHVDVGRITDGDDGPIIAFRCEVRVECARCGARFGFRTPDVGDLPDRPAVSPDGLVLRVPLIAPSELELLGPLAAMTAPDGLPGFRVRFRGEEVASDG